MDQHYETALMVTVPKYNTGISYRFLHNRHQIESTELLSFRLMAISKTMAPMAVFDVVGALLARGQLFETTNDMRKHHMNIHASLL